VGTAGDGIIYYHNNGTVQAFDPRGGPLVEEGRVIGSLQLRFGPDVAPSRRATLRRHSISLGQGASDHIFHVRPTGDMAAVGVTIPATTSGREQLMTLEEMAPGATPRHHIVPTLIQSKDPDGPTSAEDPVRLPQTPKKKTGKVLATRIPKTSTPKTRTPKTGTPATYRRYGAVSIVPREINLEPGMEMTARETLT